MKIYIIGYFEIEKLKAIMIVIYRRIGWGGGGLVFGFFLILCYRIPLTD